MEMATVVIMAEMRALSHEKFSLRVRLSCTVPLELFFVDRMFFRILRLVSDKQPMISLFLHARGRSLGSLSLVVNAELFLQRLCRLLCKDSLSQEG
jgi:hypothetical protein